MIEIIKDKLKKYGAANQIEEENAIKEIIQEIALYALWQADFFDIALFQGGTSLRILHRLPRFSEDLDFLLRAPDPKFVWTPYSDALQKTFEQFGLNMEVHSKNDMDRPIRDAVLKTDSIANQLDLTFPGDGQRKAVKIKLEIDTNPPAYSGKASSFLDFPADYEVRHQDLPSNFALKIHALLCRGYLKGRDWFDFAWYIAQEIRPNFQHLNAALVQTGPWAGKADLAIGEKWLKIALAEKISTIDWQQAVKDVERFLKPTEQKSLSLWGERFFLSKLDQLVQI
jgi:Nucleotidyl transferase AbiEii toxin, Type IV TA system